MRKISCSNCGKKQKGSNRVCDSCGNMLPFLDDSKNSVGKKIIITCAIAIILVMGIVLFNKLLYINSREYKYEKAEEALEERNFVDAEKYYRYAGQYKDSNEKAIYCKDMINIENALGLMDKEDYSEALKAFDLLTRKDNIESYKEKVEECHYYLAKECIEKKDADEYAILVEHLNEMGDTYNLDNEIHELATYFCENEYYDEASKLWEKLPNHASITYYYYAKGKSAYNKGDNETAVLKYQRGIEYCEKNLTDENQDYKTKCEQGIYEANNKLNEEIYNEVIECIKNEAVDISTIEAINSISGYKDADEYLNAAKLLYIKTRVESGELRGIGEYIDELPNDYSWGEYSAKDYKDYIKKYKSYIDICGEWILSSGRAETDCKVSGVGSIGSWYKDLKDLKLTVNCFVNENGTVNLEMSGDEIPYYTEYSAYKDLLELDKMKMNRKVEDFKIGEAIHVGNVATITISSDKISVKYSASEVEITNYTYYYNTNATYKKAN